MANIARMQAAVDEAERASVGSEAAHSVAVPGLLCLLAGTHAHTHTRARARARAHARTHEFQNHACFISILYIYRYILSCIDSVS